MAAKQLRAFLVAGNYTRLQRRPVFQNALTTDDDIWLVASSDSNPRAVAMVAWTMASFEHVVRLPGVTGCWAATTYLGEPLPAPLCHDPRGLHVNVSAGPLYLTPTS